MKACVLRCAAAIAVLSVIGCGDAGAPSGASEGELGERTDAVITFDASFDSHVTGRLSAGSRVRIRYAPERLSTCRAGANDGSPAWVITGYASLDGATPKTFHVAGHSPDPSVDPTRPPEPVVELPTGGDLAIWFQEHDRSGCNGYDSNYGHNFHFAVEGRGSSPTGPNAKVTFDRSGAPRVTGDLVAGGTLEVQYDESRLPACRGGGPNGQPAWTITGFAKANDAPPRPFYVAGFSADPTAARSPSKVPLSAAGNLELWFQVTSRFGCSEYDSNGGANYSLSVR